MGIAAGLGGSEDDAFGVEWESVSWDGRSLACCGLGIGFDVVIVRRHAFRNQDGRTWYRLLVEVVPGRVVGMLPDRLMLRFGTLHARGSDR